MSGLNQLSAPLSKPLSPSLMNFQQSGESGVGRLQIEEASVLKARPEATSALFQLLSLIQ